MRWLITSGTPGISAAGKLPDDFVGQAELGLAECANVLAKADMTTANIVKVAQILFDTCGANIKASCDMHAVSRRSQAGFYAPLGSSTLLA